MPESCGGPSCAHPLRVRKHAGDRGQPLMEGELLEASHIGASALRRALTRH